MAEEELGKTEEDFIRGSTGSLTSVEVVEDKFEVSMSSEARKLFENRQSKPEEDQAVAALVNPRASKDSFVMEVGGASDVDERGPESSTDTGIGSAPTEPEEAEMSPLRPVIASSMTSGGTTKIVIDRAPEEEFDRMEELSNSPTPPPAVSMPKRDIGIRIGRNRGNNRVGVESPQGESSLGVGGGGTVMTNRADLRSAMFWQKLSKPRGLREEGISYRNTERRDSSRNLKTARKIRSMRNKVSIKSQGKKSNQEDLALATVEGNLSRVEEIVEAFISLYMGEGFRIVMRYRYDIDPRTLEITCVENPIADQDVYASPEGVSADMHRGLSVLHIACAFDQPQVISYFLRYGAAILNISTPSNQSLLHTAAWYGAAASAALLVQQGLSLFVENATKHHPLHLAAMKGHLGCLRELIKAGSPLNFEDGEGNTPLHVATQAGHIESVKELLLYDADVNHQNHRGGTALHYASTPQFVSLLISFGADPNMEIIQEDADEDERSRTAFNLLLERMPEGCEEILCRYLKSNGLSRGAVDLELRYDYDMFIKDYERDDSRGEIGSLLRIIWADRNDLLKHPVCESFLHFKWMLVKTLFYAYLFLYAFFLLAFTALILIHYSPNVRNWLYENQYDRFRDLASMTCHIISTVVAVILVLKNLVSAVFAFRTYFTRSLHTMVEVGMLAFLIAFLVMFKVDKDGIPVVHLAAVAVFAVWFQFTMMLSNLPAAGIYINMIIHITRDVAKFLSFYASTLIAFGLCFHVLSHGDGVTGQFSDPFTSIFSTLSMMVGEIGYDVYFARDVITYQGTSQLMFVVFLLLVPIIMMNLLIGLAISNINTQFMAAGVDRLRMTVLLIRTLNNLFTVLRKFCPCCLKDIHMFSYLRRKQNYDEDVDEFDDPLTPLAVFVYPNRSGGDVFVKTVKGELRKTVFSLPFWVLNNSFKRLGLDGGGGNSDNPSATDVERRMKEDKLDKLITEVSAMKKDLQTVKIDVQNAAFLARSMNNINKQTM